MELACPTCRNTLSIPAQLANPMVRCPHCATVLDVSAALVSAGPMLAAAGAQQVQRSPQSMPQPAAQAAASPATVGLLGPIAAGPSVVAARKPPRRRKQSNGWILCGLIVVAAIGAGYGLVKLNKAQTDKNKQQAEGDNPKAVAFSKACDFVREHIQQKQPKLVSHAKFDKAESIKRRANSKTYVVAGTVELPVDKAAVRKVPFTVEVAQGSGNQWKLINLRYDDEMVFEVEPDPTSIPEFKYAKTNQDEPDDWIYGGNGPPRNSGPGADFYEGQSVGWGLTSVIDQIKESMELNKTLVVWLIDKSASAASYRQDASFAFSDKYRELTSSSGKDASDAPLLTVIGAFGKDVQFLVEEPTADQAAIEAAVNAIEQEESGQERVFNAVAVALEKFKDVRKEQGRLVMIVVVSDEAGDDDNEIENVVEIAKKNTIPVNVVGGRAPFGRRAIAGVNLEVANDLGAGGKSPNLMHQGPETPFAENISLGFFNPTYGGDDTESIDSGFGPYWLTRLANETGGVFYACRSDLGGGMRSGRGAVNWNPGASLMYTFDPKIMAKYKPQYVSKKEFDKQISENKCRKAVIDAGKLPRVETMKFVRTDFPRPKDEAQAKRELDEAQKGAATVEPRVAALYDALKPGEADRAKETNPRYQASFDLAFGRVLAAKARTEGYNAMLAKMKGGFPYTNDQSNMFKLVSDDTLDAGSQLTKLVNDSKKYLQRVVAEHPNTPWAMLAERELATPCGWKWVEELPMGAEMPATEAETEEE